MLLHFAAKYSRRSPESMRRTSCACTRTLRGLADPRCAPRLGLVRLTPPGLQSRWSSFCQVLVRAKFRFIAVLPCDFCFNVLQYRNIISSLPNVKHSSTVCMQTKPHINATLDPHPMEMDDGPTACSCVLDHWPIHSSAASASLLNALSSIFNLVALRPILIARF